MLENGLDQQSLDESGFDKLGHAYTEFLGLVIQDEVARRDQKKFASQVRRAGFRGEKTLEGFDFSKHPQLNQELIRDLATCRFVEEKVSLLIAGPCGTGKSHIAQALGHCAVRQGYDVLFATQTKLLGNLHATRAINAYEQPFFPSDLRYSSYSLCNFRLL